MTGNIKWKNDRNNSQLLNSILNNVTKNLSRTKIIFLFSIYMCDIVWQEIREGIKGGMERRKEEREIERRERREMKRGDYNYFYYVHFYNCSILQCYCY